MKKLNILSIIAALVMSIPMLTGCGDDDVMVKSPLDEPNPEATGSTVSTLDFTWDKVSGAVQYGYELADPNGEIVSADVTTATSAHFTGLAEATTYTLTVRAFANVNSVLTTSKIVTLTATTPARIVLDTPSGFAVTVADGSYIVSWTPVEHATRYYYTCTGNGYDKSSSTSKTSVSFSGLPIGDYKVTVYAYSSKEEYKESEIAEYTFSRTREEVRRYPGTYTSVLVDTQNSWPADLVEFDDGSYAIEKWYGVDGYNLEFSPNSDGTFSITNHTSIDSYGYYKVKTGKIGYIYAYTIDGYSWFDSKNCELGMYVYKGSLDGYDTFTWSPGPTIDDLAGSYTETSSGQSCLDTNDWVDYSYSRTVTISVVDDNTIELKKLQNKGTSIKGTVDMKAGTIYFAPQMMDQYYTFCSQSDIDKGITAKINSDGSISMTKWTMNYDGYAFLWGMTTTLVKK